MAKHSLAKDKIKVLLLEGVHSDAKQAFLHAGYSQVETIKTALDQAELVEKIRNVHVLGIRSRSQINTTVLQAAEKLMAIGCFCIGTNQVDLASTESLGIPVFNAPFANTRSVAELVLAEAILLLRGIPEKSAQMHQGNWKKSATDSYEARGKVLGIIGYGHIGSQLSVLAESIGMRVCFYDVEHKLPLGNAESMPNLKALLKAADIVSLHVPATQLTQNMINEKTLRQIQPGSILLNASRGNVVDIPALKQAMESGHIAGAAVDVFPEEPASNHDPFHSELRGLPNVILTPHIGGSTQEAQATIGAEVAHKLITYSDNGSTHSAVNFPKVALPIQDDVSRILHIHRNQPGVMNAINNIFSDIGVNVIGQYLQTTPEIGYVVMDIEPSKDQYLLERLRNIDGTIRTRILF